jgi:hypothetical protein
LPICVSSTSLQKSSIGWPQPPPTEKVLKFNLILHDSTPKNIFSKHQNKAEFMNLDDSEVPSSYFPGLRTSSASMTSTASIHQKFTNPDGWIILGTKITKTHPFLWNGSSNIQLFTNI